MGRAKLRMEFIAEKKARRVTYEKRMKSLEKKARELSTLCEVKVLILRGDFDDNREIKAKVWPKDDPNGVQDLIQLHRNGCENSRKYDLSAYYDEHMKKIEDEIAELREKGKEKNRGSGSKYAEWDESLDYFSGEALTHFVEHLERRMETVRSRIYSIKANQESRTPINSPFPYHQKTMNNPFYSTNPYLSHDMMIMKHCTPSSCMQPWGFQEEFNLNPMKIIGDNNVIVPYNDDTSFMYNQSFDYPGFGMDNEFLMPQNAPLMNVEAAMCGSVPSLLPNMQYSMASREAFGMNSAAAQTRECYKLNSFPGDESIN